MEISQHALSPDDKHLLARLHDLKKQAFKRNISLFTPFLNPREQLVARYAGISGTQIYGGFVNAQRAILGVGALDSPPSTSDFPIAAVAISLSQHFDITHKTVLGSLIALGIARSAIGDILITETCTIICSETVLPVLLQDFLYIGKQRIYPYLCDVTQVSYQPSFSNQSGSVASARLDNIVSMLTHLSRGKALDLIISGEVQLNYLVEQRGSVQVQEADIVTIRKHGKYIIDSIGSTNRKNRLPIVTRKYQ